MNPGFWNLTEEQRGHYFSKANYLHEHGMMVEYTLLELAEKIYEKENDVSEIETENPSNRRW